MDATKLNATTNHVGTNRSNNKTGGKTMADEIIKLIEYILNNETMRTIGTAYFIYAAIIALLVIVVFVIALKSILSTMNRINRRR